MYRLTGNLECDDPKRLTHFINTLMNMELPITIDALNKAEGEETHLGQILAINIVEGNDVADGLTIRDASERSK